MPRIPFINRSGPWEVRRTIWPYPNGWGTYNPKSRTVLDTGLSKTDAQTACDALNEGARSGFINELMEPPAIDTAL